MRYFIWDIIEKIDDVIPGFYCLVYKGMFPLKFRMANLILEDEIRYLVCEVFYLREIAERMGIGNPTPSYVSLNNHIKRACLYADYITGKSVKKNERGCRAGENET